jgi:hypothetical protein
MSYPLSTPCPQQRNHTTTEMEMTVQKAAVISCKQIKKERKKERN